MNKIIMLALLLCLAVQAGFADGNETLGPPSIAIAAGSGYSAGGVGLTLAQPGILNINVPVLATIQQVLLYWEGQHFTGNGDNTIEVNGTEITGTLIGGPNFFFGTPQVYSSAYRADITALGLVSPGANALSVGGLSFQKANNGAGIIVIYDDGVNTSDIQILDGNDLAYKFFPAPRTATVPQTFTFAAATEARVAKLKMFFSSVQGSISTGQQRPNRIAVTVGGITTNYDDVLNSSDGEEWDTFELDVNIPAGATSVTVEPISGPGGSATGTPDPRPASFAWVTAGLSVPLPPPPGGQGCTPGYWKQRQHFGSWPAPYTPGTLFSNVFENAFPGKTLLQVLSQGGGGLVALGRHTVAALLNGGSPNVNSNFTATQVIQMFNAVYPGTTTHYNALKDIFETDNEQGCPLGRALKGDEGVDVNSFTLLQNYPNPFNPETEIYFQLPEAGNATVRVFNPLGQEVRTLVDGFVEAGFHAVTWDARDNNGSPVSSGIYFYHMRSGEFSSVKKMSLLR